MSDDSWPSYARWCVPQPRCQLCQFDFLKGDSICFALDPLASAVSRVFEFEYREQKCLDDDQDIEFHLWFRPRLCDRCDEDSTTLCFHSRCRFLVPFDVTPSFLAATNYAHLPPQAEQARRLRHIREKLTTKLWLSDPALPLPLELWHMVAGYLTRECAAITAQEQDRALPKMDDHVLNLRRPVYASYVKVDGHIYVRDLRNTETSDESRMMQIRLFSPTSPTCSDSAPEDMHIYMAEDHVGLRTIVFVKSTARAAWCDEQQASAPPPGVWWRRIPFGDRCAALRICSDGLKVRQVEQRPSRSAQRDPLTELLWQAPLASPPNLLSIVTLDPPHTYPERCHMKYFDCNHPDAIGYLITASGFQTLDIAVHKRDAQRGHIMRMSPCEDSPKYSFHHWMYMPLDEGEYITHISRQLDHDEEFQRVHVGLIV